MDLDKKYTLDYVLKNPPNTQDNSAKKNLPLWKEAVFEYLRRVGIKNPDKLKTSKTFHDIKMEHLKSKKDKNKQLALFPEMVRVFNKLTGLFNRKRNSNSKDRKILMKDIKQAIGSMVIGQTIVLAKPYVTVINKDASDFKNDGGSKKLNEGDFEKYMLKKFHSKIYTVYKGSTYPDYYAVNFILNDFYDKDVKDFYEYALKYFKKLKWNRLSVYGVGKSDHRNPTLDDRPSIVINAIKTNTVST